MRRTHESLEGASGELARTKDDHSRLMVEAQALQRNLDGQLANKADLQRQAENEDAKNRDLQANLFERETRQRQIEDQLMIARKEQENLRFSNNNLLERN
jgi:hypothetical protein